jgi:uncharacterized protein DUF3592
MISGQPFRWIDPSSWPWFVYVWLAFIAAGWTKPLWRWIQRQRASSWPTASGQIEYAFANQAGQGFFSTSRRGNSPSHISELAYSYLVAGNSHTGRYKRDFWSEKEALEFARDLKGKPVTVHYNPGKPSDSTLLESSVETLLNTRPPKSQTEIELSTSALADDSVTWPKPLLWACVGLSALGLVVSLWVHLGAVAGRRVAPEEYFWILHMGIFVVWFPAVLVARKRVGSMNRKDFWKVILKDSPDWMRYMVYGFSAYAMVNFTLFFFQAQTGTGGGGNNPPAIVWRGFSGHWMAFYSAALAILHSAANANTHRCSNGHAIPRNANFCTRCGQPVMHS